MGFSSISFGSPSPELWQPLPTRTRCSIRSPHPCKNVKVKDGAAQRFWITGAQMPPLEGGIQQLQLKCHMTWLCHEVFGKHLTHRKWPAMTPSLLSMRTSLLCSSQQTVELRKILENHGKSFQKIPRHLQRRVLFKASRVFSVVIGLEATAPQEILPSSPKGCGSI